MLSSETPPSIYLHANAAGMLRSFDGLLGIVGVRRQSRMWRIMYCGHLSALRGGVL